MTQFVIRDCWDSNRIVYEGDAGTLRELVETAVRSGAMLFSADLRKTDLSDADLRGAQLFGADLSGADLRGADFSGADLRGATFLGADLVLGYNR